ncbi:MAG: hypothetical protein K5978_08665 [Campylobacter sp.]|nr:hypothetical protein [Campylobacter sp.]
MTGDEFEEMYRMAESESPYIGFLISKYGGDTDNNPKLEEFRNLKRIIAKKKDKTYDYWMNEYKRLRNDLMQEIENLKSKQ